MLRRGPRVCLSGAWGPVETYYVVEDDRHEDVCLLCFTHQVEVGQWVEASD